MPADDTALRVVERLFQAMEGGPEGEEPMMELFSDGAVFIETFTGRRREHVGREAIRRTYRELFSNPPPPDMKLQLHRVDRDGERVRAEWSCMSSSYLEPRRGFDLFTVRNGEIEKLEVVITQFEKRRGGST
ncbi:MAG TPA: nuclear transport factor 2 family protein [Vicinamibacteria bacterium]|nr:nuclear transport factor 2 family protein [Vicinamibacteria bacterium]